MPKSRKKLKASSIAKPIPAPPSKTSAQAKPPAQTPSITPQPVIVTPWVWTKRIGAFLAVILPLIWLIIEKSVEPLVATIAGLVLAITTIKLDSQKHQLLDKLAALALGVLCFISLTLIIKTRLNEDRIPVVNSSKAQTEGQVLVWYATGITNELKRDVSIGIWSDSQAAWLVDTLQPEETKWHSDTALIYMTIQGDLIAQPKPNFRFTHTYPGEEAYELESRSFNHQPNDDEIKSLKPNKITEILGGPTPKYIDFLDGSKIPFEVFSPTGIRLKWVMPAVSDGQHIYPFQMAKSYK